VNFCACTALGHRPSRQMDDPYLDALPSQRAESGVAYEWRLHRLDVCIGD
jgi:hypothetical protein